MKNVFSDGKLGLDQLPLFEDYKKDEDKNEYLVLRNGPDLSRARKLGWKPVARYVSHNAKETLVACERTRLKEA